MTEEYYATTSATTGQEVAVESGRLVLVPVAGPLRRAMDEFCLYVPFAGGKLYVYASIVRCPSKTKKRRIACIDVVQQERASAADAILLGHVWGTLPMLFIGDATFFYAQSSDPDERARAISSCRRESRPGGSYRCANGQVGVGVRLGEKDLRLTTFVSPAESTIRLVVPASEERPPE